MKRFYNDMLFTAAIFVTLTVLFFGVQIAKSQEAACAGDNVEITLAQVVELQMPVRKLTVAEAKRVIDQLPLPDAADTVFDDAFIVVHPMNGVGAFVLARGGNMCGHAMFETETLRRVMEIIDGRAS
jgi:hypothetical protein